MPSTRIVLTGLLSLAVAMGIGRFAFTPLLPVMRADGLISIGEGGWLAAIHFLGYLLGALYAARLRGSPAMTLRLSLFAIAFATLATGLTDHFVPWAIMRFVCGVCSAFTLVLVSNYFVKHLAEIGRPDQQGWVFSGVGAGIALAGLGTLILMAADIGSADGWVAFGVLSLIVTIGISLKIGTEMTGQERASSQESACLGTLPWTIVFAYGAAGIGYIIPATYLPVMAREIVESPLLFGLAWPVFGVAAFLSTLIAGRLQARWSNRQIWSVSQLVMAAGLLLPVLRPDLVSIILAGVCVGGTFMIITMMGMKEAHRVASPAGVMRLIAVMTASFAGGQMIGPLFASAVFTLAGGFQPSLVLTSGLLVVTAWTLMRREPLPQN